MAKTQLTVADTTVRTITSPSFRRHGNLLEPSQSIHRLSNGNLVTVFISHYYKMLYGVTTRTATFEVWLSADNGDTWSIATLYEMEWVGYNLYRYTTDVDIDDNLYISAVSEASDTNFYQISGKVNESKNSWSFIKEIAGTAEYIYAITSAIQKIGSNYYKHTILGIEHYISIFNSNVELVSTSLENMSIPVYDSIYLTFEHTGDGVTPKTNDLHFVYSGNIDPWGSNTKYVYHKKASYENGEWVWGEEEDITSYCDTEISDSSISCYYDGSDLVVMNYSVACVITDTAKYAIDTQIPCSTSMKITHDKQKNIWATFYYEEGEEVSSPRISSGWYMYKITKPSTVPVFDRLVYLSARLDWEELYTSPNSPLPVIIQDSVNGYIYVIDGIAIGGMVSE